MTWPKTIGYGTTLLSATVLIHFWCNVVHWRFRYEHPDALGKGLSFIFWDYSWVGIAAAGLLNVLLIVSHIRRLGAIYETTFYFSLWLLVVWFGAALIAMELVFVPWTDLRGSHY
jgi:hypothetical protein